MRPPRTPIDHFLWCSHDRCSRSLRRTLIRRFAPTFPNGRRMKSRAQRLLAEIQRYDFKATRNKSFLDVFRGRESEVTGLALAESITCVIDDSALRASPFGPASPFCLRQSRAAHPCAAATLTLSGALNIRFQVRSATRRLVCTPDLQTIARLCCTALSLATTPRLSVSSL
jgi:hypothetical protein